MILTRMLILATVGGKVLGIIIPAFIFLISFVVTWLLYKHFSSK
jgi:hypothetical protein